MGLIQETPVGIVQIEEEFLWLLDIYKRLKPKRVLEIGVKDGGTLYHWLNNASWGAHVVAVDTKISSNIQDMWHPIDVRFSTIEGKSQDVVHLIKCHGKYDWVFIDGDHSYDGVLEDWNNFKDSRVVVFHDICPNPDDKSCEVPRLWREIKSRYFTLEYVKDYTQGECGIGVVLPEVHLTDV